MKKTVTLMLVLVLVLIACGCTDNSGTEADTSTSDTTVFATEQTAESFVSEADTSTNTSETTTSHSTEAIESSEDEITEAVTSDAVTEAIVSTEAPTTEIITSAEIETTEAVTSAEIETTEAITTAEEETTEDVTTAEEETTEDVTTAEPEASEKTILGKITENNYENAFIGLGYNADDNWKFYTDEQMRAINNIALDLSTEDLKALIENSTVFYDMLVTDEQGLNNININLEKVDSKKLLILDIPSNFEFLAPIVKENLENMGYTDVNHEVSSIEIDGKTLDALNGIGKLNGFDFYQTSFAIKCDGYYVAVTITTYFENSIPDLLKNFYWIE